ncbi:MAG: hypothetical protein U1F67_18555 [Rubrivivax sp.]
MNLTAAVLAVVLASAIGGCGRVSEAEVRARAEQKAQKARGVARANPCEGVRFNACFINSDGTTCRNEMDGPLGRLIANGSYSVVGESADAKGICVLTLSVAGTVDGNSYSRTVRVWGHRVP